MIVVLFVVLECLHGDWWWVNIVVDRIAIMVIVYINTEIVFYINTEIAFYINTEIVIDLSIIFCLYQL